MQSDITTKTALTNFATTLLHQVVPYHDRATVVVLHGDLGAGKTTLVQQLGQLLGSTDVITSPTYTILQSYGLTNQPFTSLVHMDAYRLDDLTELAPLRFGELLQSPQTLICIEWGSKISAAIPVVAATVTLAVDEAGNRTGTILTT